MPGSSARDPSPTSSSSGAKAGHKRRQKLTRAANAGSRKKDKYARDSGGVVAALTKHGVKFPTGSVAREVAVSLAESPPSPLQSPQMKPAAAASFATDDPVAGMSPLLDAVSSTSIATSAVPSMSDWTKHHGVMEGSPNLISLMGESPPTQPSSYEDTAAIPRHWTQDQQQRAFANTQGPSISPPAAGSRRPLSFPMDSHAPAHEVRSQASSPAGARTSSVQSPFSHARISLNAHPPHQAQRHYYRAPDVDFDFNLHTGLQAGDRGYYFGFDTWSTSILAHMSGSNNVVLTGYEGGLDVHTVSKRSVDFLTSLKGLRGGAYHAKMLPWNGVADQEGIYPLVAVVIHGPVLPQPPDVLVETRQEAGSSPRLDGRYSPLSDVNQRAKVVTTIEAFQTTVELYSLRTNGHICTLLQAPLIPVKSSVTNPLSRTPPPTGCFHIRADGGSVVVSSGASGECWVFRPMKTSPEAGVEFRCVGKLWTSLQQALVGDGTTAEDDRSRSTVLARQNPQPPIVALNGRWLAYCPPAPSTQIALNAKIGVAAQGKAPGVTTLTSPVLPNETSDVVQPADGRMNEMMRKTTQEVIQGARWVGKQGMQLWNSYWKQSGTQAQPRPPPSGMGSPPGWGLGAGLAGRGDASQFPPTYGVSGQAVTKDPGLVSIVDLETLENSSTVHPVTTFKAPLGCSFLSFAPTGLSLFTASSRGDVQTIWDLMRIQYSKSSPLQNPHPNSGNATRVRQIAQFSRMTVARIVDVAWAKPNGERAAMVTERGTVHLLDVDPSAYAWPPPRHRVPPQAASVQGIDSATATATATATSISSTATVLRDAARRVARPRSNSTAQGTSRIMDHAAYGGKAIAAGISHSLGHAGTAISHLRHNGENRVSLPSSNVAPGLSCVAWITGKRHHTLFVAGAGLVRSFQAKPRKAHQERPRPARGSRYKDFTLKTLPDDVIAPVIRQLMDPDEDGLDLVHAPYDGGDTLILDPRRRRAVEQDASRESCIPQAEIESSAPYQPFHTDRRVAFYECGVVFSPSLRLAGMRPGDSAIFDESGPGRTNYKHRCTKQRSPVRSVPWAFGQDIAANQVEVGLPLGPEDGLDMAGTDDHRALPASAIERVLQVGENEEQIVVTTRRRRGGNRPSELDDDGFFEDDCEVLDFADQRV